LLNYAKKNYASIYIVNLNKLIKSFMYEYNCDIPIFKKKEKEMETLCLVGDL